MICIILNPLSKFLRHFERVENEDKSYCEKRLFKKSFMQFVFTYFSLLVQTITRKSKLK